MPKAVPRACRKPQCSGTTTDPSGWCPQHVNTGWEMYQQGAGRQERGYGCKWDKLRPRILERDKYLCQQCQRQGKAVTARAVDHITPKAHGGTDEPRINDIKSAFFSGDVPSVHQIGLLLQCAGLPEERIRDILSSDYTARVQQNTDPAKYALNALKLIKF